MSITSGSLPDGLNLEVNEAGDIMVIGTPTAAGTSTFTIRIDTAIGSYQTKEYSLIVWGITNTPTDGSVGNAYNFQFTASGGTGPYTYEVSDGLLPDGLTLTSTGLLWGTPTSIDAFDFTVKVTDASNRVCEYPFVVVISAADTCPAMNPILDALTYTYLEHIYVGSFVPKTFTTSGQSGTFNLGLTTAQGDFTETTAVITNTSTVDWQVNISCHWEGTIGAGAMNENHYSVTNTITSTTLNYRHRAGAQTYNEDFTAGPIIHPGETIQFAIYVYAANTGTSTLSGSWCITCNAIAIHWPTATISTAGAGTATFTGTHETFDIAVNAPDSSVDGGAADCNGRMPYNDTGMTMRLTYTVTPTGDQTLVTSGIQLQSVLGLWFPVAVDFKAAGAGTHTHDFVIPTTGGLEDTILIRPQATTIFGAGNPTGIHVVGSFTKV